MRDRWNKLIELAQTREALLIYGAVGGAMVIMLMRSRPVRLYMISDEIMSLILEHNGVKIVPK